MAGIGCTLLKLSISPHSAGLVGMFCGPLWSTWWAPLGEGKSRDKVGITGCAPGKHPLEHLGKFNFFQKRGVGSWVVLGECHARSAHAVRSFECRPIPRPYFWPLLISFWFHAGVVFSFLCIWDVAHLNCHPFLPNANHFYPFSIPHIELSPVSPFSCGPCCFVVQPVR